MNDTPAPFTFKAARPASSKPLDEPSDALMAVQAADGVASPRRRRGPNKLKEPGEADELSCFLEIVNRLQAMPPALRKRALTALQGLFS